MKRMSLLMVAFVLSVSSAGAVGVGASCSILCEDVDCFWEGGGFVTFDRAVERFDRAFLRDCHRKVLDAYCEQWERKE